MNIQPVKITIADLQSKFRELESEKNQTQFFIKAADYGKYIIKNVACSHVLIQPLQIENQNDTQAFKKAYKEFFDEWLIYAIDIIKQAKKADIQDDPTKPVFSEIKQIKRLIKAGESYLYKSDVGEYYVNYWKLVRRFNDSGKSSLLIPMHFVAIESPLNISSSYKNASDEWTRFQQSRDITVWWAHYQIKMLATGILNMEERKEYIQDDEVNRFYQFEFNEVAKGNLLSIPIVLHYQKYIVWIKRLHEYLIPRLELLEDKELQGSTQINKKSTSFSMKTAKLEVEGKFISIPKNTDQFDLCKTIFKDELSKEKEWPTDEILEEWGSNYEGNEIWRKVYNAAREINQKVAAKTTIEDFLFVNRYTTKLNPKYA